MFKQLSLTQPRTYKCSCCERDIEKDSSSLAMWTPRTVLCNLCYDRIIELAFKQYEKRMKGEIKRDKKEFLRQDCNSSGFKKVKPLI